MRWDAGSLVRLVSAGWRYMMQDEAAIVSCAEEATLY